MSKTYTLSIMYAPPDPRTYRGVRLFTPNDGEVHLFESGNPHVDYMEALSLYKDNVYFLVDASVRQFVQDGGDLSGKSDFVTDQQVIFLFTGEPLMHNGNHDPVEEAAYNSLRIETAVNADRTALIEDRHARNIRDQMTVDEAIEYNKQITLLSNLG